MWKRRGDLVEGRRVPVENFQAWASDLLEEAMANRASGLVSSSCTQKAERIFSLECTKNTSNPRV